MTEILVGSYLFQRLKQLGVNSVFGVPGDYELMLLDLVPEAGLTWRGNPNELNAGYAADGYARVNGVGAVVTTFGPGELSNMCPIAGSYTEFVPVVHIVGYPTEAAQHGKNIMHHSLGEVGDGKFNVYHEMSKHITCASAVLHDAKTAASEIDKLLNAMLLNSQPVYLGLPTDIAMQKTPAINLKFPLTTELVPNKPELQSFVVEKIREMMGKAENPIILVDGSMYFYAFFMSPVLITLTNADTARNRLLKETKALIATTGFPYFATAMSKGFIPENLPTFGGVYGGAGTLPEAKKVVESSDCTLWLGSYPARPIFGVSNSIYSGEFTEKINENTTVDFQRFFVKVGGVRFDVKMKYVLDALVEDLKKKPLSYKTKSSMGSYLQDGDFVITETGTSAFGIPGSSLQHISDIQMFNQTIFGSIGFASGAAVGAFVAGKEAGTVKRNILITGEGSLQLTVQAFSDLLRHEVHPTVFVLNNGGYTVERLIHGMEASYNTVPVWDYGKLFRAFGPDFKTRQYTVKTPDELDALFADEEFKSSSCAQIVELFLGKHDAPLAMKLTTAAIEEFNKRSRMKRGKCR
ncbi:Pyruvate decarboxylase [Lachnellula suecica]|uniref:Pyruvate decarboxylase n=1 Tax=Lachnellula suecica TaxID=602035 RepID=A0A8T9CED5_9HELO|nr:Pyruvate decarboxylase [Lachnellula suecica]